MKHLVLIIGFCLLCNVASGGPVRAYYNDPATKNLTYMENDLVKITIAKHQGKIVGWLIKSLNVDVALSDELGWGMVAQRFGVFDAERAGLNIWPDTWPTPIGTGDYQTFILVSSRDRAVVRQTMTVGAGYLTTGLRVDKYYVLESKSYSIEVFYVVTNTSRQVVSSVQDTSTFGITLTVETTVKVNDGDSLAFKTDGEIVTSPIPLSLPPGWDQAQPIETRWCALENLASHYVVGSLYLPCETHGLWPGESRPGGADYEIVFRPVIYKPWRSECFSFTVYGGPGNLASFSMLARGNSRRGSFDYFRSVVPEALSEQMDIAEEVPGSGTDLPKDFGVGQNYPNPFNPSTVISYQLPSNSYVTLKVYDILGRDVATLVDQRQDAGIYNVTFNSANLPSGIYFYRLTAGSYSVGKKMILMK